MTKWIVCPKGSKGFTLVEFIVAALILVTVAAFIAPRWGDRSINLYAQAQALANDIRYTQNLAMSRGKRYRLIITTASNSYTISNTSGTAVTNPLTGGNTWTLGTRISFGTLTNLPSSLIAFDGQGKPYTNSTATTLLASTASITLTSGSSTRTVLIYAGTGKVAVQ